MKKKILLSLSAQLKFKHTRILLHIAKDTNEINYRTSHLEYYFVDFQLLLKIWRFAGAAVVVS